MSKRGDEAQRQQYSKGEKAKEGKKCAGEKIVSKEKISTINSSVF